MFFFQEHYFRIEVFVRSLKNNDKSCWQHQSAFKKFEQLQQVKIRNNPRIDNGCFLAIFRLLWAMFPTSQHYEFDEFTHKGP